MSVWLYVLDVFKPVDMDTSKFFTLAEEDPIQLFSEIKEVLKGDLEEIKGVKLYNVCFNPKWFELLIEYIVKCSIGEISVKTIYPKNPQETLRKYYSYERSLKKS